MTSLSSLWVNNFRVHRNPRSTTPKFAPCGLDPLDKAFPWSGGTSTSWPWVTWGSCRHPSCSCLTDVDLIDPNCISIWKSVRDRLYINSCIGGSCICYQLLSALLSLHDALAALAHLRKQSHPVQTHQLVKQNNYQDSTLEGHFLILS